jgi:hypothetical protein
MGSHVVEVLDQGVEEDPHLGREATMARVQGVYVHGVARCARE